mgnify:CR=1 FL=1
MDIEDRIYQWYIKRNKIESTKLESQDKQNAKIFFAEQFRGLGGILLVPRFTKIELLEKLVNMDLVENMQEAQNIFLDFLNFEFECLPKTDFYYPSGGTYQFMEQSDLKKRWYELRVIKE